MTLPYTLVHNENGMKRMIFRKYADLAGQVLMLFPLLALLPACNCPALAFGSYATVGLWQTVSYVLTATSSIDQGCSQRRIYGRMIRYAAGAVCLFTGLGLSVYISAIPEALRERISFICIADGTVLLIAAPLIAFWYAAITIREILLYRHLVHHRSEIHWKL